ncbi:hypothetical protein HRbin15_00696 [bacterium HR15]|nr:hypothetical protein HRbin15_00696 [bacterium HR15]
MNETLLLILIVLMALTLLILSWATIALLVQARRELPVLRQRVDELNGRLARVLEETVPVLQTTTRALEEAAETIENLHIVTDNLRHKLEVADEVAGKMRRMPEKAARMLGRLMHYTFKLGGQLLFQRLQAGRDRKPLPTLEHSSPMPIRQKGNASSKSEEESLPGEGEETQKETTSSTPTGVETASHTEANPTNTGRRDD